MSVEVVMPQMGESITEGTVSKWLKKVGDKIEKDEAILEISTDKVDAEVPSPGAGVLLEIRHNEGDTVEVGTVLAVVGAQGEQPAATALAAHDYGHSARDFSRFRCTCNSRCTYRSCNSCNFCNFFCRRRGHAANGRIDHGRYCIQMA